jgi:hypothetical protein
LQIRENAGGWFLRVIMKFDGRNEDLLFCDLDRRVGRLQNALLPLLFSSLE